MKIFSILFGSFFLLLNVNNVFSQEWHTTPDKWKEPRMFHSEFDRDYESRIRISQARAAEILDVSQSRVSDLIRGKWERFSLEMLITLATRAGMHVTLKRAV
jgi:hypothetical protein